MRTDLKSRLRRASTAIAVGFVALVGVASTADAQSCNTPYSNCGWTWGERYGAPPPGVYYSYPAPGYYPGYPGYYAPQPAYPPAYGSNPQAMLGQIMGLFVR